MKKYIFLITIITFLGSYKGISQGIVQTFGTNPTCIGNQVCLHWTGSGTVEWRYTGICSGLYQGPSTSLCLNVTLFSQTITARDIYGTCYYFTVYGNPLPSSPTASNNSPICAGSTLTLATTTSNLPNSTYSWTGPNGFTSSDQNPLVSSNATISMSGEYNVVIYSEFGCNSAVGSTTVIVNPSSPIPTAGNNGPVCTGNVLSLTASTISGATYSWTGPNGFTSTQQNPIVSTNATTAMAGIYTVAATANGCPSQPGSTTVIINQATAGNNGPVCSGHTLSLTASTIPGATYYWTGPNGFSSTAQNPTVNASATSAMAGVYSVYTTANGCTSPTPGTTNIVVNPIPSTPTAGNNGPVCVGNTLSVTSSPVTGATYSWTGPNSFTATQQNPTVSASATTAMGGIYSVIATISSCASIAGTTTVEINRITASNNGPVCVGKTLSLSATTVTGATYSWTGPNGFTSSQQNPTVSTSATSAMGGIYSATSTVNGCTSPASVTIVTINPEAAAPIVISPVTYCQNATASPLTATGSGLLWYTTPTGGTGSSTAPTPSTTTAGITIYYVSQTVGCESQRASISVIINPLPSVAGTISGTATVCQGQNSVTYSVLAITNATSYMWTLPSGATGTSTTNSIAVSFGVSAVSGNITVKGNNTCGNGATSTLAITVNTVPASTGTISGASPVCQGQNSVTYTVPTIANATSYNWTLPSGATGTSTNNSITVNYGTSAISGNITVKGSNTCGDGEASTLAITVNPLPTGAGTISGATNVCQGQNAVTYTVPVISNATSYVWTLPGGATGISTTNSIIVSYGVLAISENIAVKGNNICGDGAASTLAISVNPLPAIAGTISGTSTVCPGQNSVTYTVPAIANATSYVWTLPSGAAGTSTTNSITVSYSVSATSGNIAVKGNNTCGDGATSTLAIIVNSIPTSAGTISGAASVCQGQNSVTYTVPAIPNAASYVWTLPDGATGTSTTNSIIVNYSISAISGNITVKGNNTCGDGAISTLALTVNSTTTPATSNNGSVCTGDAISLAASTIAGANYSWTGPNGFTSTQQNPTVSTDATTAMEGIYSVTATTNGCPSQPGSTSVVINQATAANNGPVCSGQTLSLTASTILGATYYWTGPNGFSSTSQNPTVSANATSAMAGVYSVYSIANGCTSPTPGSTTVVVNPISTTPTAGNNGPVCVGKTLSVTASTVTGATYSWSGPNSFTSTQQNPTVSASATSAMGGVYSVIATISGCTSIAGTTTVEINKITAGNNGPVCVGKTLSLSATTITGATYAWTGSNGFTSSQQNPTVSNSATSAMGGVYIATSTANGCTSPASVTIVTVNPEAAAPIVISPVTYCQNATASPLSATGSGLLWYPTPTGGIGSSTAPTPSTTTAGTTFYYVSQTVGCESQRASISVIINPLPSIAGTIAGITTLYQGQGNVIYSVPIIPNAASYIWQLPTGFIGTSSNNVITVTVANNALSGNISVKGHNGCGDGNPAFLNVSVFKQITIKLFLQGLFNTATNLMNQSQDQFGNHFGSGIVDKFVWNFTILFPLFRPFILSKH